MVMWMMGDLVHRRVAAMFDGIYPTTGIEANFFSVWVMIGVAKRLVGGVKGFLGFV